MTDKKPVLKFKTNLAEKFVFVKMFKQGENDYGKFYCCEIRHDDTEKTMFASQALWDKMNKVTEGDTVEATLSEIKSDDGKTHKEWKVTINGKQADVSITKPIVEAEETKQEYHKDKEANLPNWDRISWGKCKHAFLVEIFKGVVGQGIEGVDLEADAEPFSTALKFAEPIAEEWANASMGMLNKPLLDKDGELPSERDKEKLPFDKPF